MMDKIRNILCKTDSWKQIEGGFCCWRTTFGLLLLTCFFGLLSAGGCKPKDRARARIHVREPVCIAKPSMKSEVARQNFEWLSKCYPEALVLNVSDFSAIAQYCLVGDRVLIIPDITGFPIKWWDMLEDYLRRGGLAFFMGTHPFYDRIMATEKDELSFHAYIREQVKTARHIDGFSSIQLWRHMNESGKARGSVRVPHHRDLPWDGVTVQVVEFDEWDIMSFDDIPAGTIPPEVDSLAFYAHGDTRTTKLVVKCYEQDGALWNAVISLPPDWTPFLLHETTFTYVRGGENEEKRSPCFSFTKLARMEIGLYIHTAPQEPGKHLFGLSDIRMTTDIRDEVSHLRWPDIPPLSPACRHYSTHGNQVISMDDDKHYKAKGIHFQSPFPTARGWGGTNGAPTRLIPLFKVVDKKNIERGWPVSIHLQSPKANIPGRLWAWIAMNITDDTQDMLQQIVPKTMRRLYQRMFLYEAGCEKSVYNPNENMQVSAQWISGCHSGQPLRIAATLRNEVGQTLRRVVSDAIPAGKKGVATGPVVLDLGLSPDVQKHNRDYSVRITLEDAAVRGRVYDEIIQPIKIMPPATSDGPWISMGGARFREGRRPVFMLGVQFQPLTAQLACETKTSSKWLQAGMFNPSRITAELDRLEAMGINALALSYEEVNQAPQLRFFIDEASKRHMWIYLTVAHLSPVDFDEVKAERLIKAASLAHSRCVFAFDLACVQSDMLQAQSLPGAWQKWLREQYGSIEHAEEVIGYPLWRNQDKLTVPPSSAFNSEGEHRVAMAVFRRFMDDHLSRQYGYIRRFLRRQGCPQLLSTRYHCSIESTSCHLSDPAPGVQHMDFISLDSAHLTGSHERFLGAVFLAVYARGISGGKPVVWMDYGINVGRNPALPTLRNQARIGEEILGLAARSLASGCFGGAWGETGVPLIHADGSGRPIGEIIRRNARKLINDSQQPPLWKGREFQRSEDARGLSALWAHWKEVYREEAATGQIEEARPDGFGQNTLDMALVSVGHAPFTTPAALEYANAEWGAILIEKEEILRPPGTAIEMPVGKHIKLELINTGITTWSASQPDKDRTVWIEAIRSDGNATYLQVGVVPTGQSTEISWSAPSPGPWLLRPYIQGVGGFGEPLNIQVKE